MFETGIGSLGAAAAAMLLVLWGVTRELAPAGGLTGRGRWMLACGLGMGVLAFVAKLGAIVVFGLLPEPWIHQQLAPAVADRTDPLVADMPLRTQYRWQSLPLVAPAPADNPTTPAKVALGRRLFNDKNLSSTGDVSCATCHDLEGQGGADGRSNARGVHGQVGTRNTPTVWNAAFQARLFWDGRAATLEEQAQGPLTNPIEMGLADLQQGVQRIAADAGYRRAFEAAFGAQDDGADVVTPQRLLAALAAFERTLITPDSPYDRYVRGDAQALSAQQLRGMALFDTLGCVQCHSGPAFSGASVFDDTAPYRAFPAVPVAGLEPLRLLQDTGRAAPGSSRGVWRIPGLRNVALTAPYFHNGSVASLKEAVRIMAEAQLGLAVRAGPALRVADDTQPGRPAAIFLQPARTVTEQDIDDVAAFLKALTSEELAGQRRPAGAM